MICAIYKSDRKIDTYLYVLKKEDEVDLEVIPEILVQSWGELIYVMDINLAERDTLARADIHEVRRNVEAQGFYLQLPPSQEELKQLEARLSQLHKEAREKS